MIRYGIWLLLLPAICLAGSTAEQQEGEFRNLGSIEEALDPLQFANHDGVRHYGIDLTIAFAFDSDRLLPEAAPQIEALGRALSGSRLAAHRFLIIGHTDGVGTASYNLALSLRRANTVRSALVDGYQIDPDRLDVEGKGFTQPKPDLPPEAAAHRRVEVRTLIAAPQPEPDQANEDRDVPIEW